jgi:hypothetical protein
MCSAKTVSGPVSRGGQHWAPAADSRVLKGGLSRERRECSRSVSDTPTRSNESPIKNTTHCAAIAVRRTFTHSRRLIPLRCCSADAGERYGAAGAQQRKSSSAGTECIRPAYLRLYLLPGEVEGVCTQVCART